MAETDENTVRLVGRVTSLDPPRELPSGDVVHTLRVTVGRPRGHPGVDTVDVACWSAATRRCAGRLQVGARVEVEGSLRRRFWRTGGGPVSRYEVQARRLRRVTAA
ncbi:single-stranded DNA-binding protein [Phycicoccus endophyticus]|uniref:Single-stranded DNA-binding protein n=1 Tax=Phycicoccus endophyticus TaxID=1690220 RepID=A0A7G9R4L6_9MICO|nr:single-stranded DNA-binding protein [Phycicoccus endophyticus]NHI18438.1 single-stranded DNA-binding protein [Phycicoccus endophyticus]QNN50541.1 single-stranded DNA-binding protein [Phycicoccus endophyticus]